MKRGVLITAVALIAMSSFAGEARKPRPFSAQLFDAGDGERAVKVILNDRLPDAIHIYFHVEVFDASGAKIGQFGAKANVPSRDDSREVVLELPHRMRQAESITVWASGYRARNSNEIVPVDFPPGCRTFCMTGRNECNAACAEAGGNVAFYECYTDGEYCYYDCYCH